MTANIGVGIIGLSADGGWGSRAHLPALRALDGFEVRALSASTAESARRAGDRYGIDLVFDDPRKLALHEDVDVVSICVRVPQHAELVRAAVEAGKTVFCEWPLARDLDEARTLATLAARAGVRTAVGLQARSTPTVRYLGDLISDGYLGTVLSTTLIGSGGGWSDLTTTRTAYTLDKDSGATMLSIPFGHTLDALTFVLGGITEVSATGATVRPHVMDTDTGAQVVKTAQDQIAVSGKLAGGAVLSAHYRGGSSPGTNFLWEINGTEGDLVVSAPTGHLQFGQAEISGARKGEALAPLAVPATYLLGKESALDGGALTVAHGYSRLLQDLETGSSTVPDFEHAVAHHRILDAIEHSASDGVRVEL